jgi:hypothetical protein
MGSSQSSNPGYLIAVYQDFSDSGQVQNPSNSHDNCNLKGGRTWILGDKDNGIEIPHYSSSKGRDAALVITIGKAQVYLAQDSNGVVWSLDSKGNKVAIPGDSQPMKFGFQLNINRNPNDGVTPLISIRSQTFPDWYQDNDCYVDGVLNSSNQDAKVQLVLKGADNIAFKVGSHLFQDCQSIGGKGTKIYIPKGDAGKPFKTDHLEIAFKDKTYAIFSPDNMTVLWCEQSDASKQYLLSGGCSFVDSPLKYLEITGASDPSEVLRLVESPNEFLPLLTVGHTLGPDVNLIVHTDPELLQNCAMDNGKSQAFDSFLSRIAFTDRDNKPYSCLPLTIQCAPVCDLVIAGTTGVGAMPVTLTAPNGSNGSFTINTGCDGVVTVTQPVVNHIGGATLFFSFNDPAISAQPGSVFVHAPSKLGLRVSQLKTPLDFGHETTSDGKLVFPNAEDLDDAQFQQLRDAFYLCGMMSKFTKAPPPSSAPLSPPASSGQIAGALALNDDPNLPGKLRIPAHMKKASTGHLLAFDFTQPRVKDRILKGDAATQLHAELTAADQAATVVSDQQTVWQTFCKWARGLWGSIKKLTYFIANEIVTITTNVGKFVATWVADVWQVVSLLLSKLFDVVQDTVVRWLGELLDWDSITKMYNLVCPEAAGIPALLNQQASAIAAAVASGLDFSSATSAIASQPDVFANKITTSEPQVDPSMPDKSRSGPANWANDRGMAEFRQTALTDISASNKGLVESIVRLFKDPTMDIIDGVTKAFSGWENKDFATICQQLFTSLEKAVTDFGRSLGDIIKAVVGTLATAYSNVMGQPCPLPFLAPLWRDKLGKSGTPTLLEMTCFISAIGGTYLLKFACWLTGIKNPLQSDSQSALAPSFRRGRLVNRALDAPSGTSPEIPQDALNKAYGCYYTASIVKFLASAINACVELMKFVDVPPQPFKSFGQAILLGCAIFSWGMTSIGGSRIAASSTGKAFRTSIGMVKMLNQCVPFIQRSLLDSLYGTGPGERPMQKTGTLCFAIMTTIIGVADLVLACIYTATLYKDTKDVITHSDAKKLAGLCGSAEICNSFVIILAGPRAFLEFNRVVMRVREPNSLFAELLLSGVMIVGDFEWKALDLASIFFVTHDPQKLLPYY